MEGGFVCGIAQTLLVVVRLTRALQSAVTLTSCFKRNCINIQNQITTLTTWAFYTLPWFFLTHIPWSELRQKGDESVVLFGLSNEWIQTPWLWCWKWLSHRAPRFLWKLSFVLFSSFFALFHTNTSRCFQFSSLVFRACFFFFNTYGITFVLLKACCIIPSCVDS